MNAPQVASGPRMLPSLPMAGRKAPSREALWMLLNGSAYLLLLCASMVVAVVLQLVWGRSFPDSFVDDRDLVALFGWVGLTISGVSTIVLPNHVGVGLWPRYVPRLHLAMTNVGILGFFGSSLLLPGSNLALAFLLLALISFLIFGTLVVRTVLPFALGRSPRTVETPVAPGRAGVPR